MTIAIVLDVEAEGWQQVPAVETLVSRVLEAAARGAGVPVADAAEVSVLLCDDAAIRTLNRDWRGLDKATNVLSFPAAGALATRPAIGDLALAWETTQREALLDHKTVADHLAHLLVHGYLHLVGFDHDVDAEADAMERRETEILATLAIADPYRDTEPADLTA